MFLNSSAASATLKSPQMLGHWALVAKARANSCSVQLAQPGWPANSSWALRILSSRPLEGVWSYHFDIGEKAATEHGRRVNDFSASMDKDGTAELLQE